jgi:hypothetical protein
MECSCRRGGQTRTDYDVIESQEKIRIAFRLLRPSYNCTIQAIHETVVLIETTTLDQLKAPPFVTPLRTAGHHNSSRFDHTDSPVDFLHTQRLSYAAGGVS